MEPMPPAPDAPPAAPAAPPVPRKSALAYLGLLLALLLPGLLMQAVNAVAGLVWTELYVFLLPAIALPLGSNLAPRRFLGLRPPRPAVLAGAVVVGVGGFWAAAGVMAAWQLVIPRAWVEAHDLTRLFEGPAAYRLAISAAAALLAPVCEEIAFRGYLQTAVLLRRSPARAILTSTLVFSALHLDPVRFPALLVLGALFGWVAWRAGSVWASIAAHATNNGIATLLALASGGEGDLGDPTVPEVLSALAFGLLLLGGALALYRRVTPVVPPPAERVALLDPADPDTAFSPARVPYGMKIALQVGAGLALVILWAALFSRPLQR